MSLKQPSQPIVCLYPPPNLVQQHNISNEIIFLLVVLFNALGFLDKIQIGHDSLSPLRQ